MSPSTISANDDRDKTRRVHRPSSRPEEPRAPGDRRRNLLALAAIAAFFALGWMLVGPRADVPVIDDWVYAWSVEQLLATHRLQVLEFSAIYPVAQILWGALFASVAGFSFVALRLSTVVLSVLGCWAVYLTLREAGCRSRTSLLGAFALACDPVFFALSFSFMTDVPFVDLSAIAAFFYVSAVRRERYSRLWVAGLCSIAAFLIRPIGMALPLMLVPALAIGPGRRRRTIRALLPVGVTLGVMAALQAGLPRVLGALDWAAVRQEQLKWVTLIPLRTYVVWTIRVVLESVFPIAPLLLAPLVGWRRALGVAGLALLLIAPIQRSRGEIPSPLPDWQTWSLQDIGARAVIAGDPAPSAWSIRAAPLLRALGLLSVASLMLIGCRGLFGARRWGRSHDMVIFHALVLLASIHALWLYNDRYYLVLAPAIAITAAWALDADGVAQSVAAALLVASAVIAVTGTRDLLAFNAACAAEARRLEAIGVPAYEIDAGYPVNGWRLYAHPEKLPAGADRRYDVPFVTSERVAQFTIVSHPRPGADVVRVVPLPSATWQATRQLYVVRRAP